MSQPNSPTFPASQQSGQGAPVVPGATDHSPATTTPAWAPNVGAAGAAPAGVAEAANAARGQRVIDAIKDLGRVDTTRADRRNDCSSGAVGGRLRLGHHGRQSRRRKDCARLRRKTLRGTRCV